jgi:hypothetical protein
MRFKKELIDKLSNGEVALDAYPVTDDVEAIVKEAFPEDREVLVDDIWSGEGLLIRYEHEPSDWIILDATSLPIHKPEDFINDKPERGDWVMVGFNWECKDKRIFLTEIEGAAQPVVCVMDGHETKFRNGKPFNICNWESMEVIPQVEEMTLRQVICELGREIKIVD